MSDRQPPPYDGNNGGQSGPWEHNPQGQQQPNPYGQPGPYGQGPIPSYPGGGQPDVANYGQQPTGMPPLANWGARAGSYLLDALILGVPYAILRFGIGGTAGALLGAVVALAGSIYFSYMEGTTGQTPGKKIVGTRTLREADGQVLGFGLAFGRRLLHILDALPCYLGFLWPAWDAKKQTFADKLVHSVVIKP
ncbi:RDD family protein [Streptomyces sp. NPDC008139]|uniref:RDD family protein n=1 Tax=Streptomyces sp. NPDC008139 TaxID=3364814 RepID=UPI0036E48D5F